MIIIYCIGVYVLAGMLFSIPFLLKWIYVVDESTVGSSAGFRLTILPGCIVFWPVLLSKYIRVRKGDAHD